jgi:predicted  nucleic acid-binding Zn-ribbon protein
LHTVNSYPLCFKALQEELESVRRDGEKKDEGLKRLEQQLHDAEEEKQLVGKKGAAVMKDLQRQLAAERKRAEKLQDRIRDLLNEGTRARTGSQFTTEMGKTFCRK